MSWIADMLPHTISYQLPDAVSSNDVTHGTTQTCAARVEQRQSIVRSSDETERVVTHVVATQVDLPVNALVWLPGVTVTPATAQTVMAPSSGQSFDGEMLYEVVLG